MLLEGLPGYIENNCNEKLLTIQKFKEKLHSFLINEYNQTNHYSRIGFAHEFDNLSKDETHHILEYKWSDLGIDIKLEDFSDYEAITTIIKITKGNFRLIHRLFAQIDRILRINQMDKITVEVVEATRDSLVIGI